MMSLYLRCSAAGCRIVGHCMIPGCCILLHVSAHMPTDTNPVDNSNSAPLDTQAAVQGQANKLFASISEANTVLSDPVRRSEVPFLSPVVALPS